MSDQSNRGLSRLQTDTLPPSFRLLPEKEQVAYIQRMVDSDIDLRARMMKRVGKSEIAEHDLSVAIDTVAKLQDERKVYSLNQKGETGSGTYELTVRGGDTKFIRSLAWVLIAVVAAIFVLMSVL